MRGPRLLLIAALATTLGAAAPPSVSREFKVSLGDGTVNAAKLKPYDNALVANQITADGQLLVPGIWTDQLRLREIKGRKLWVRIQTLGYYDGRVISSVNMFDPVTFAPVGNLLVNPDGSREVWTFTSAGGEGHITDTSGHETVMKVPSKAPSFDFNCCMRSLIPAALPLAAGRTFALPAVPAEGDPDVVIEKVR